MQKGHAWKFDLFLNPEDGRSVALLLCITTHRITQQPKTLKTQALIYVFNSAI